MQTASWFAVLGRLWRKRFERQCFSRYFSFYMMRYPYMRMCVWRDGLVLEVG